MWCNKVETKPGTGYPTLYEDQEQYDGGWVLEDGKLRLRLGSKKSELVNIAYNPRLPTLDDYYHPFTYRELPAATEGRPERRIAVQEYGRPNAELLDGLRARGGEVTPVRVYQWDLPENVEPLRQAARLLASGAFHVALFTTAIQIAHLARVARELGIEDAALQNLRSCQVCSIGPTTTEALEEFGIHPMMEPSHPKMGFLVKEAAQRARQ